MKRRELENLGIPRGEAMAIAGRYISAALAEGKTRDAIRTTLRHIIDCPADFEDDAQLATLAEALTDRKQTEEPFIERAHPAPWQQWGDDLDANSVEQLDNACRLPIAVRGALMPDAHLGYGLPIGGVLATDNAVIPYAVGVDIACRMKLSVLDMPVSAIRGQSDWLTNAIERETRFGIGARFQQPREHDVMDRDWSVTETTKQLRDKAWTQLGTSGSGNHFVEFGELTLEQPQLGMDAGTYLALLTHSGSRGTGASVAAHYSKLAMQMHPNLPKQLRHLAWLDLSTQEGQDTGPR